MNIVEALANYIQDLGYGTIGTDIFIGGVPQDAPSECWWLVMAGGSVTQKNETGESLKNYVVDVFFRSIDAETVYNELHNLEVELNSANCTQLQTFDTIDITTLGFPVDQDIDNEERTIGTIQATIKTYYKE